MLTVSSIKCNISRLLSDLRRIGLSKYVFFYGEVELKSPKFVKNSSWISNLFSVSKILSIAMNFFNLKSIFEI